MKIKHWQGYGSVEATRFGKTFTDEVGDIHLSIQVIGNHEYGIRHEDNYDLFNWLVKKFYKNATNYRQIKNVKIHETTVNWNTIPTDCCIYEFILST